MSDLPGTPQLDQYYPGGASKMALDWNLSQHQAIAGGEGTTGGLTGPTGPTGPMPPVLGATGTQAGGGCLQIGNIILNWGTCVANQGGVDVAFELPYVNGVPVVTCGTQGNWSEIQATPTATGVRIDAQSGTPTVYWISIGS